MAALGRFFGKFFGRTIGDAASFAIGGSISRTIDPVLQGVENEAWTAAVAAGVSRPPDAGTLAEGVAQGQVPKAQAYAWGAENGYSSGAMDALVNIANVGPGMAQAFNLWRRTQIDEAGFRRALKRIGLEPEWIDDLWMVRYDVLDPADLARAIHRGLIPDPGLLKGRLPTGEGNVPAYPVYPIDALKEALAGGYDPDHLGVLVGLQGLPMGSHEAAQALFRGVLDENDYLRAISEGNTRNEWADAIMEQSRQIPTVHEGVENAIRGYSTLADAIAVGARHGMTAEDVTLIYQNAGRPLTPHQITIGLARGAKFNPIPGEIRDPYEAAAHEASVKPSYQELYIAAGKYSYPSLFQLNALVKTNAIPASTAKDWATRSGLAPEVVDALGTFWEGEQGGTSGTGPKVKTLTRAEVKAALREGKITAADALTRLEDEGLSAHDAQLLLDTWAQQAANQSG